MNHFHRLILCAALFTSISANAEVTTEPALRAPAAASSHSMNFRFSPLALLLGGVGADFDFKISDNWTLGPSISFVKFDVGASGALTSEIEIEASALGVRANWFKNGAFTDGFYIGPFARVFKSTATSRDSSGEVSADANGLAVGSLFGYGWFWENFNMMLGGGLQANLGDSKITIRDSSGTDTETRSNAGGLALEWTTGWAF